MFIAVLEVYLKVSGTKLKWSKNYQLVHLKLRILKVKRKSKSLTLKVSQVILRPLGEIRRSYDQLLTVSFSKQCAHWVELDKSFFLEQMRIKCFEKTHMFGCNNISDTKSNEKRATSV